MTGREHEPCADPGGVSLHRLPERQARPRHVRGLPLHHRQHVSSHLYGLQQAFFSKETPTAIRDT